MTPTMEPKQTDAPEDFKNILKCAIMELTAKERAELLKMCEGKYV